MRFKIISDSEQCRRGTLEVEDKILETPACFLYTRGGSVPHVTNDVLLTLGDFVPSAVQLPLATVTEQPGIDVIRVFEQGIAKFLGLEKRLVYMSVQDPQNIPPSKYNENKNVSVWCPSGRKKLDARQFMEFVETYKPHLCECLCDTLPMGEQTEKRIRKSVDRTLSFLDEIIKAKQTNENLQQCGLFGVVEGSDSIQERIRSAQETAKRETDGFVLEGFCSRQCDDWSNILQKTTDELPKGKIRILHGIGAPDEVLKAIECGVDLFDSSFVYQAAERGCAIAWRWRSKKTRFDVGQTEKIVMVTRSETQDHEKIRDDLLTLSACEQRSTPENESKKDKQEILPTEFEIDLRDTRFKEDLSPLVSGCACYCCTQHTRAYVHHLLVTREMLAPVLLMIHNMYQYFNFFQDIREAIEENKFENFKQEFLQFR